MRTMSYVMLTVTRCHSECCVQSSLDFEDAGGSVVRYCLSNYLLRGHVKHDMGALTWLKVETLNRVPTLLFGRLVRYSAHGRSFMRLRYILYHAHSIYALIITQVSVQ